MRKTIVTETIYGLWKIKATVRKWLAIHRHEDDYWVITHVPSGRKLPGYFLSKDEAIAAAKVARQVFPYPLNLNEAPSEGKWFAWLEEHMIQFVK